MNLFKKDKKVVSCNECKCLLYKDDAQQIEEINFSLIDDKILYTYYCNAHKKNYDKVKVSSYFSGYCYYKEMEVDEKGEPIGYKKINNK